MTNLDIYLKGGAVIPLDLEDFTVTMSPHTGHPTKVTWVNGKSKPLYIAPSQIAAVIER